MLWGMRSKIRNNEKRRKFLETEMSCARAVSGNLMVVRATRPGHLSAQLTQEYYQIYVLYSWRTVQKQRTVLGLQSEQLIIIKYRTAWGLSLRIKFQKYSSGTRSITNSSSVRRRQKKKKIMIMMVWCFLYCTYEQLKKGVDVKIANTKKYRSLLWDKS